MSSIKVKPEFADKIIGFNGSSAPLGKREDLHLLYGTAKAKNHKEHLDMFEVVDEEALDKERTDNFMKKRQRD